MAEWRRVHPEDVQYENNYWMEKKAERRAATTFSDEQYRLMELGQLTILDNDDRWLNTFPTDEEGTGIDYELVLVALKFSF
jgi:hypothetical protein